jgi:predicted DNA binding CopG/RHH family protein
LPILKNKIPDFKSDAEAEAFVDTADLSQFDLTGFKPVRFEFQPKDERINMRLPANLLQAVRRKAEAEGMPYQRFIRATLERAVAGK